MTVTCPWCKTPIRPDAASCDGCGSALAPAPTTSMALQFPAEHPIVDVPALDTQSPAPAPTLVPSLPPPTEPPRNGSAGGDQQRPRQKKIATVMGTVVAAFAVVLTIALISTTQQGAPTASSGENPISPTTLSRTAPSATTSLPSSHAPLDESSARQVLQTQVANDRPRVEALTGYWVPQLSSKRLGLVANGTMYSYQAIWADFASMRARYPGAMLLWSGDYSSFRYPDFWVTIAPVRSDSGEAANAWCVSAGIGKDDCYAKRITHTGGYAESTLFRK